MKLTAMLIALFLLTGCNPKVDDLQHYVADIKQSTQVNIEAYPEFTAKPAFVYQAAELRSPFSRPKNQTVDVAQAAPLNCLQPDFSRPKQALESYGLDALRISGSFRIKEQRWILIEANDNSLHKATVGDYVGLFFGKITAINGDQVVITEMLPDGAGCWQTKQAELSMATKAGENTNV